MPEISSGSFVYYFGQKVGVVEQVSIVEDVDIKDPTVMDQQYLEIQAVLFEDLGLRQDCKIVASGPPLGGIGMLEILSRGRSPDPIVAGEPIYGRVAGFQAALNLLSQELDEANPEGLVSLIKRQLDAGDEPSLMVKVHQSLADINALTASLARELDRAQGDVLISKVHISVDRINSSLAGIDDLVEQSRPKIDRTLSSIDRASVALDKNIVAVLAREFELEESQDRTLLAKVHEALTCLNESLADLNVLTEDTKGLVVLNKDRISELIENATTASLHLKQGVRDLSLHPWKILFEPSEGEKRELHIHNAARDFAEAAAHLDDSTSRLMSLLQAREGQVAADDPELTEIRARLADTVDRFGEAERALWAELAIE